MLTSRRRISAAVNVWPGYVDALAALLMLVIFTLLIFTLAQVFLAEALSSREQELSQLNNRLSELSSLLDLEKETNSQLNTRLAKLSESYTQSLERQYDLFGRVKQLENTVAVDKEQIALQLRTQASLQQDILALRRLREELEQQVANLVTSATVRESELARLEGALHDSDSQVGLLRDRSMTLQAQLADEQERTLLAQKQVGKQVIEIEVLSAVVEAGKEALETELQLSANARIQVDRLNRQIDALREQLAVISRALKLAEGKSQAQEIQLTDMGKRLNTLLAQQVNELERYRSEFFGRLRTVLADDPNIRVVGDRFVFPSELLFATGSATLGVGGQRELDKLARIMREIATKIPPDVAWLLRVDGHTDRRPIRTEQFPSNWELSTARAVSVVRYLASRDIAPQRMAATGFGEFHPIDQANTAEALQRNRRIEIKLTDR